MNSVLSQSDPEPTIPPNNSLSLNMSQGLPPSMSESFAWIHMDSNTAGNLYAEFLRKGQNGNELPLSLPMTLHVKQIERKSSDERVMEGKVNEIGKETFFANFVDLDSNSKIPRYHAEFKINDLTENDQSNLHIGSIVIWKFGIRKSEYLNEHYSNIVLRDKPHATKTDLEHFKNEVEELLEGIDWHGSS